VSKGRLEAFGDGVFAVLISIALYVAVALVWLVPDRRIESTFTR